MFSRPFAHSVRLAGRRSALARTRAYSTKPSGGFWAQVPVEAYPLIGIVSFICCVGIGFGVHAISKEKENFAEHKSTGNTSVKYV